MDHRLILRSLVAALTMLMCAANADATHTTPTKAKKLKFEFVREYAQCTAPDTTTSNLFPACSSVSEPDACNFGPDGKGKGSLTVTPIPSALEGGIAIKVKLNGLNAACEGQSLSLRTTIPRWTVDDCSGGPCTVVDLTDMQLTTCTVTDGTCSINTTLNGDNPAFLVAGKRNSFPIGQISIFHSGIRVFRAGLLIP